jgi:hypothetical protein
VVVDEDRSTLQFVKRDGDWLVDGIEVDEGSGTDGASTEEETTPEEAPADDASTGGDEVEAQAAVDAFLIGVADGDAQVLCGLFSEGYAKKLTGAQEFGIAECVEQLKGSSFDKLRRTLKGVEVKKTVVEDGGQAASVQLSNGNTVSLAYQDGRFVIVNL